MITNHVVHAHIKYAKHQTLSHPGVDGAPWKKSGRVEAVFRCCFSKRCVICARCLIIEDEEKANVICNFKKINAINIIIANRSGFCGGDIILLTISSQQDLSMMHCPILLLLFSSSSASTVSYAATVLVG